ncbi:SMP-30/gluconolactonase/LRE family protein [Microlunatus antarcticus]|uniref:Sugar lactone lactonase YvrE n=1 Tax=Microlunatus antarcticus TaxID=53388 RepID=A0A7W5JW89_9ACTN|nr:SMP-30/gluconolactonase/LRE family protein [Microlunatus antarcticus]MBB3327481.1 sugar lactone lactonase YvrE [Microlunatus antarcticus]
MRAQQVTGPAVFHGEGPVWSPTWGGLRFVDMLAGDVMTLRSDGTLDRLHVGTVAAVVRPRTGGGAVIAVERGFALEDADGTIRTLPAVWAETGVRMNEGGCDPDGRFYAGSMAYDQAEGAASVYRLDPDGSVSVVLERVTVSNGLEWSPDGTLAYYNDTPTGEIAVFDYSRDAGLTNRRTFASVPGPGKPDGLTVDADGGVWTAVYDGGAVLHYSAAGVLEDRIEVPTAKVTACTFGGDDLDRLFITTSQEDVDTDEDQLAGSLFVADVGVRGRPVRPFAG